jgi:hypothetical protein
MRYRSRPALPVPSERSQRLVGISAGDNARTEARTQPAGPIESIERRTRCLQAAQHRICPLRGARGHPVAPAIPTSGYLPAITCFVH